MSAVFINAGIKEIYFIPDKIAFPGRGSGGSYTGVYGMGIRQNGNLTGNHLNEIRDNKNRAFPNLFNFKVDCPTMQVDDPDIINALITSAKKGGAAVAVVTSGVAKSGTSGNYTVVSPNGGLYIFDNAYSLGVDFELRFGLKERQCNITFEGAFKYGTGSGYHDYMISQSATNDLAFVADTLPKIDNTKVADSFISPSFIPSGVSGFGDANIVDFMCSVKTKSAKNGFNNSIVSALQVELTCTASGVDAAALADAIEYEFFSSATPISVVLGTLTLKFGKGGLTRIGSFDFGDDKREVTFTYSGEYDLEYVATASNEITFNAYLT
ncbi:MAG: hypothetical protein WC389_16295 [Lutibacter sp.]|jgi:hypothetical protein